MTDIQRINAIGKYRMRVYRFNNGLWQASAHGHRAVDDSVRKTIDKLVKTLRYQGIKSERR